MTEQEIHDICKEYNITNYSINPDGSIDVDGNVDLNKKGLIEIPLKFNKVSKSFLCKQNQLTSLYGSPERVDGYFSCEYNKLTSLEGCPKFVGRNFNCNENNLTSLEGFPKFVGRNLLCTRNPLESLEGYNLKYYNLYCDNKEKLVEIDIIDRKKKKRKEKLKLIEKL